MVYKDGEQPWTGTATPDHVGYGANGHPVRCLCGWGPGTSLEFVQHIHELPPR